MIPVMATFYDKMLSMQLFISDELLIPFNGAQVAPPEAEQQEAARLFCETVEQWQDHYVVQSMPRRLSAQPGKFIREFIVVNDWMTNPGCEELSVKTFTTDDSFYEHEIIYRRQTSEAMVGYNYIVNRQNPESVWRYDCNSSHEVMRHFVDKITKLTQGIRTPEPEIITSVPDEALPNLRSGPVPMSEVELVLNSVTRMFMPQPAEGLQVLDQDEFFAFEDKIRGS